VIVENGQGGPTYVDTTNKKSQYLYDTQPKYLHTPCEQLKIRSMFKT